MTDPTPEEEQAQDQAFRARLSPRARQMHAAPRGFSAAVMDRIYAPQPAVRRWVPVMAMAAAALVVGVVIGRRSYPRATVPVTFSLEAPRAMSVSVAGDFTGWNPKPLQRGQQSWSLRMKVPKGRHRYLYILNGRAFVIDPNVEEVASDDAGRLMSVLDSEAMTRF